MSTHVSIRQDPVSLAVAVCTNMDASLDTLGNHNWLCLTTQQGAFYADDADVSGWLNLYTAP